ncbi:unnamed protein product [Urochloa humidicola]
MGKLGDMARAFSKNRWLVFVAAMWVQSMAGTIYMFGAISPVLKARLGYDQRQLAALGVAKNAGGCLGLLAGAPGVAAAPRRRRPELPRLRMPLARRRRPHAAAAPLAAQPWFLLRGLQTPTAMWPFSAACHSPPRVSLPLPAPALDPPAQLVGATAAARKDARHDKPFDSARWGLDPTIRPQFAA